MLALGSLALSLAVSAGPPKLPPMPGNPGAMEEGPAEPQAPTREPSPEPKNPPKKAPAPPARAKSTPEAPTAAPPPGAAPDSSPETSGASPPPSEGDWRLVPELVEPPQPATSGPPPEPVPEGSKAAPPDASGSSPPPGLIGEDTAPPQFRLPPPERPPFSGIGLFVGAGVTFASALAEQIVAHIMVDRRCIRPLSQAEYEDAESVGEAVDRCAPSVLPAVVLRVHSDLALIATIGLATAGGVVRGRRDAWDHVFKVERQRKITQMRVAGIVLMATGVVTWFTTGAAAWGWLGSCKDAGCVSRARVMAFTTRDLGAGMIAAGGGLLGYAEAWRRSRERFARDKIFSIGPSASTTGVGVWVKGEF